MRRLVPAAAVLLTVVGACATPPPAVPGAAHPDENMPEMVHDGPGHGGSGHGHEDTSTGSGLTDVQEGFRLIDVRGPAVPGSVGVLSFRILDPSGAPQTRFEIEQTQLMHVYVVRADLTDFHHVHPTMTPDGRWSAPLTVASAGPYRVVTEFGAVTDRRTVRPFVLGTDLLVPGPYRPEPLPAPAPEVTVDGYTVKIDGDALAGQTSPLTLRFTRVGVPATDLQPYLGTYAHLTAFHPGNLEVVHVHPSGAAPSPGTPGGPALTVDAEFPAPGLYRTYIQFQTDDIVRSAPITIAVR